VSDFKQQNDKRRRN